MLFVVCGWICLPAAHAQETPDRSDSLQATRLFVEGMTLAQIDRPEEALAAYREALEFLPEAHAIFSAMAGAYEATGETSTALLYAQQAAVRAPGNSFYRRQVERLRELRRN